MAEEMEKIDMVEQTLSRLMGSSIDVEAKINDMLGFSGTSNEASTIEAVDPLVQIQEILS